MKVRLGTVTARLASFALLAAGGGGAGGLCLSCATVRAERGTSAGPRGSSSAGSNADVALPSGTRATDFTVRDTKGRTVRLSDYLGKKAVLLDFWATYCEPCLGEMPHLEKMYEENKDKGFVVIALAMDGPETVAEVPSFAARNGLTFPVVLDADSHVASIYNPKSSAPLSVLIDKQGNVVRVREGYNPGDEALVVADVERVVQADRAK
jgi:peroxiredoxin